MAPISWTRRSYEATVLLVPLDASARDWTLEHEGDLAGITVADRDLLAAHRRFHPQPVPASGEGAAVSSPLDHAVHEADVVVVLTHDMTNANGSTIVEIADAARSTGKLLGAVVVSPDARWAQPAAHRTATTLREAADNVIILKDSRLVPAFLQVLRGGARDEQPAGAVG